MTTVLHVALSNAAVAGLLALVAAAATWRARSRPALGHGLWLLVLVKLLTPPLVGVPLGWRGAAAEPVAAAEEAPLALTCPAGPTPPPGAEHVEPGPAGEPPDRAPVAAATRDWVAWVSVAWFAGAAVLAWRAAWRVGRLRRLLDRLPAAPPRWQRRVAELAGRLGLRRPPRVRLTGAALPPLVVAPGRATTLVIPLGLWRRLDDEQRDAIVLHELAHLRRGDHRVRLLELLALALYWWLPLAWWASRRLRQAEEECCDAWVVWASPGSRPAYAAALVETVAFLSGRPAALPVGASGAGPVMDLKRRLSMILQGETPRGLTRAGWPVVLGCLVTLPLMPTTAESQADTPGPRVEGRRQAGTPGAVLKGRSCVNCHTPAAEPPKKADAGPGELHDRIVALLGELNRQRAQAARTEKQLKDLLDRYDRAQAPKAGEAGGKAKTLEDKLDRLQRELEALQRELRQVKPGAKRQNPPPGSVHFVNRRRFNIPYRVAPEAGGAARVALYCRAHGEENWKVAATSPSEDQGVSFSAPADGRYEFTVSAVERGQPPSPVDATRTPDLAVVVDTVPPVLSGEFRNAANGLLELHWSARDDNLDLATLRVEYRLRGRQGWKTLRPQPAADAAITVRPGGEVGEVRLSVADRAGNVGKVTLTEGGK